MSDSFTCYTLQVSWTAKLFSQFFFIAHLNKNFAFATYLKSAGYTPKNDDITVSETNQKNEWGQGFLFKIQ